MKLVLAIFLFLPFLAFAQEPLTHEKGSYVDSLNRYYQQAELPLYITVSHKPDGKGTRLGEEPKSPNTEKTDVVKPIYLDGHGKHYLRHVDAIHHHNQNFAIYADGIAPKSAADFTGAPSVYYSGVQYYGKGLQTTLSTSDEMSGVKTLYQSVSGQAYAPYTGAQSWDNEGVQSLKFYAVDNVGNAAAPVTKNFTVDLSAPETFHTVVGIAKGNIISTSTKIILEAEDKLSGVAAIYYQLDDGPKRKYTGGNLPFAHLPDGDHVLKYFSVDRVKNEETAKTFAFYLDKTAPIMSADVLGDKFVVGDQVYFSGRTKLKLTAVDNKAGIKHVKYSIDGGEFSQYDQPFYLPSKSGIHIIRYYAVDEMSNEGAGNRNARMDEYLHNVNRVYVDLTGPTLDFGYQGPTFKKGDTVYINNETRVKLSAKDPESGLQYIAYALDGGNEETRYNAPFPVNTPGNHSVDIYGYDNVNNRNIFRFHFIVDVEGPEIAHQFSIAPNRQEDGLPVYPAYVTLFLTATDMKTGYKNIYYKINNQKQQVYNGLLRGFKPNKKYHVEVEATDMLGNKTTYSFDFKTDKY
jgi:hypothetical protein